LLNQRALEIRYLQNLSEAEQAYRSDKRYQLIALFFVDVLDDSDDSPPQMLHVFVPLRKRVYHCLDTSVEECTLDC